MPADDVEHLTTLGVDPEDARVYSALLSTGTATASQVAALTGRAEPDVRHSFTALVDSGLVSATTADHTSVCPVPPAPGLELLTRRRQAELDKARVATMDAFGRCRHPAHDENQYQLTETVHGPVVGERIAQLERAAVTEVRALESPPYYASTGSDGANAVELDNLERGIRYQVVYARAALEHSKHLTGHVMPSVKAGERARTLPAVPVKLLLIDDSCGVVSLSDPLGDVGSAALLVRSPSLLSGLAGLFTMSWNAALPLDVHDNRRRTPRGPYLRPSEHRLLGLLAAGLADEEIARSLHVSRRTLYRYLEGLMTRTGAENRFQLAVHATRNGWI